MEYREYGFVYTTPPLQRQEIARLENFWKCCIVELKSIVGRCYLNFQWLNIWSHNASERSIVILKIID